MPRKHKHIGGIIGASPLVPTDEHWDDVTLLLDGSSANDATGLSTVTPSASGYSTNNYTSGYKFSQYIDMTGGFFNVSLPSAIGVSNKPFTVETWVWLNSNGGPDGVFQLLQGSATITSNSNILPANSLALGVYNGNWRAYDEAGVRDNLATAVTANWHHVALTCDGTNLRWFLNGTVLETRSISTVGGLPSAGYQNLAVGAFYNSSESMDGRLEGFRVTKGVARYTANFTPPTTSFPTTSSPKRPGGVSNLGSLSGDRAAAVPTFPAGSDFKISNGAVTGATYGGSGPTGSGYSSYWDTSSGSNYFYWTPSNATAPSAFTVIVDFETTNTNAYKMLASFDISHPSQRASFHANNVGEISWYDGSVKSFGLPYSVNTRYVAIAVYNGTTITGYLVDTASGTAITSADITAAAGTSTVTPSYTSSWNGTSTIGRSASAAGEWLSGQVYGGAYWPSALTEAQLVDAVNNIRGNATVAGATRPTRRWGGMTGRPLVENTAASGDPHWSNVELLLDFEGQSVTDHSGNATGLTIGYGTNTSGGTAVYGSGANAKNGSYSFHSSGTGVTDPYIKLDDPNLGTGAFTLECWLKTVGTVPTYANLFGNENSQNPSYGGFALQVHSYVTGMHLWRYGQSVFTGNTNVRDGNWHHIALTRDGSGVMHLYVDGSIDAGPTTETGTFTGVNGEMYIGNGRAWSNPNRNVPGYIDDIRITKGVARDIAADWTAGVYNSPLPQGAAVAASTTLLTAGVLTLAEHYQSKL